MTLENKLIEYLSSLSSQLLDYSSFAINHCGSIVRLYSTDSGKFHLKNQLDHLESIENPTSSIFFIEYGHHNKFNFQLNTSTYFSDRFSLWYLDFMNSILIKDNELEQGFIFYRNGVNPYTSDYLRVIFQFFGNANAFPIHGGSIAWNFGSALISNVGGSGKSTLIASSIIQGAKTTGDDFGMFNSNSGVVTVWSQFATLKLASSSPARKHVNASPISSVGEKDIFRIDDINRGSMVQFHKIDSIIIPVRGDKFAFKRCTSEYAFRSLAPSSSGMALNRQLTNLAIESIVMNLPCFQLVLSSDSQLNSRLLKLELAK